MNIMLIDDDDSIRMMLQDIIEDYDLGEVVSSLSSATNLDAELLRANSIDILIIDMLMPDIDGIAAVARIKDDFAGKIIMLSQVESKDLVSKAYAAGINFYITKPLNRNEIVSVLKSVSDHLRLESFAHSLQSSLAGLASTPAPAPKRTYLDRARTLLNDLGVASVPGANELLEICKLLERGSRAGTPMPSQKTLFASITSGAGEDSAREAKAIEQRLRRLIFAAMQNVATMGMVDYTNPKFEEYAPALFDYSDVRALMCTLEDGEKPAMASTHINMKKFITALFDYTRESH